MRVFCQRAPVKRIIFSFIVFSLLEVASVRPVFAQYDADYNPLEKPEESVEGCPRLEGDQAGLGPPGDAGDIRQYRTYDYKGLPEMRGDAGINQAKQVKGAWCGQVKSDPIQLQEDASWNLRRLTQFCQERRWKFDQQMNYNFASNPDANFRIPFAEEMARQWGGIWDAEHESEQTIDTKERIRAGGSADKPLTSAEEAIRGQVITEVENKTGVAKMLTSLSEQDDLKRKFIDYVKVKIGKTQYENYTINGTKLIDIPYPPQDANGKTDYTSRAYTDWNKQWGPTWSKLALFPNERTTGEFKFDVCDDFRYTWWYGYPEVMKMTLAANTLFQILQPKQVQDQMYTDKFTDLRDPLKSQMLIGEAFGDATGGNSSIVQTPQIPADEPQSAPAIESPSEVDYLKKQAQAVRDAIGDFITSFIPKIEVVFAQSLEKVVPNNPVSQRLLAQNTSPVVGGNVVGSRCFHMTANIVSTSGTDISVQGCVVSDNGKSGHMQYFFNGQSQGTQTVFDTRKGNTYCFPPVPVHLSPGQSAQSLSFGVKMDECGDAGNANGISCQYSLDSGGKPVQQCTTPAGGNCRSSTLADGTINNPCAPDLAGPPPPNKPPEEKPVTVQCLGQTCLNETKYCKLGCEICKRAQLGPSDTETTGNWYKGNHMYYGGNLSRPVEWTWKPPPDLDPYTEDYNCAKDKGSITCRCGLPGCYTACRPQCPTECMVNGVPGEPDYDIQKGNSHRRTVDLYNNVPFLEAAWKLVAGNYNTAETGFLHAFTIDSIKGQGNLNAQGCTSDANVVFDSAGNFVPLPGASWAFWTGNQIYDWTNDRPELAGETAPHVKQIVPSADEGRAKILFYRLGGLCNANKWVSGKELLPKNLQQQLNRTTNPFNQTSPYITPTPAPASVGTKSSFTDSQTVAQKLATIDPSLSTGEVPTVTTVTSPQALSSQPVFSAVQINDQIAVYPQANKVVVYRPQTNTIITQTKLIKIALRNGTTQSNLFGAFAQDLAEHSPNIVITEKIAAVKSDYKKTILIDPSGTKKTEATTLAVALGLGVGDLPQGEPVPAGGAADFLIIYGGPEVALRNGTTTPGALTSFQASLTQAIPTSVVTSAFPAAANVATSFIADPTGKRAAQAAAIGATLGIHYAPSLGGEPAPFGNVFLIVLGTDKIPTQ